MYYYGKSDTGMRRSINQDMFCCKKIWGNTALLCVVCDGIGGHKAGEIASTMAVDLFCASVSVAPFMPERDLKKRVMNMRKIMLNAARDANREVYEKSRSDDALSGMGTTIVAALITDNPLFCFSAGDSRLYMIERDTIKQVTRDHTFTQRLLELHKISPEEARTTMKSNVITRALGIEEDLQVDCYAFDLSEHPGSHILLCTDGLTNHLTDEDIFDIVAPLPSESNEVVQDKVARLIDTANANGGSDNITAVLIAI